MSDSGVGIRRVGQIAIVAQDLERARSFYADVLGLRHMFDAEPAMSFFDCDGVRLMLTAPDPSEPARSSILYLDVADIHEASRVLSERGVTFEHGAREVADLGDRVLWLAFFRDSESNLLALMSEPLKSAQP